MRPPSRLASLLRNLLRRDTVEVELDRELRSVLDLLVDEKRAAGLGPGEARRAALLELGGVDQVKERLRDVRAGASLESVLRDVRYGLRRLARQPSFTAAAILILALGIGATTSIFSVVDAVLLRALPFADPERLVQVSSEARRETLQVLPVSVSDLQDWRAESRSFEALAGYVPGALTLSGEGDAERLTAELVSADYFAILGAAMVHGRALVDGEDRLPAGVPVAVLGHGLWERRFQGAPDVVGRTILLDGRRFTVVGVAAAGFQGVSGGAELWIPLTVVPEWFQRLLPMRGARWFQVVGRLGRGVSLEQARSEMAAITAALGEAHPETNGVWGARVVPLSEALVGNQRSTLLLLFVAVAFVLCTACANVAGLLLARAAARRKEMAIRSSLGASRLRLVRQLLTEALCVAGLGGGLGLVLAMAAVRVLRGVIGGLPAFIEIGVDGRVLLFTAALTLMTSLLFGLAPALRISRGGLRETLGEGGRGSAAAARPRVQSVLVVGQLSMAVVLLVGTGLLVRSLAGLVSLDPGLDPGQAVIAQFDLPDGVYPRPRALAFIDELRERLGAVPGVEAISVSATVPLGGAGPAAFLEVDGRPLESSEEGQRVYYHEVSPEFFRANGIPVHRGRTFLPADRAGAPADIVVSESAAQRMWPGEDPLGRRVRFHANIPGRERTWQTVVGVVRDVRYRALTGGQDSDPDVYVALAQSHAPILTSSFFLSLRPVGAAPFDASRIRDTMGEIAPHVSVYGVTSLRENVRAATDDPRLTAILLGSFAAVALMLAAIGVYGLVSYSISQRTQEIGLRMALGAERRHILWLVVAGASRLATLGLVLGLLGALALTRLITSLLFGVSARDPATFAGIAGLLAAVAIAASLVPALRATAVDPTVALRRE